MIKSVTIQETTFNFPQASAANQRTIMSLISKKIMAHSVALANEDQKIGVEFVKGVLLTLPEHELNQIHQLFLQNCAVHGQSTSVDIQTFQGKMNTYYTLLAETVVHNLADFFTWLDEERNANLRANNQAK